MESKLTYEDLKSPTFVNTCPAVTLTAYDNKGDAELIELPFSDIPKIAVLSGTSFLCIGDTGTGKSQLMMDIHRNYFGSDADNGGKSNWSVARNDFKSEAYFMTFDQSKVGPGKNMLTEARVPVEKRVKALCNVVDELNLAIPEVQVEFFGIAEGRHKGMRLGDRNYHLFMSSCNLNRVNGEFAGTSQINRALLNRFGVTFDFDYFKRTDEDEDVLSERENTGKLELAPVKDISDKILDAYSEIQKRASQRDPWLDAYIRFFSSGLEYCETNKDKTKKKIWPTNCNNCKFNTKDLCSLVKQSTPRTTKVLKLFANGINYLVALKYRDKKLDPFDLAIESFKFTTYHGNLNGIETLSRYGGEDQEQMIDVCTAIRDKIKPVKKYIDDIIDSAINGIPETRFIRLNIPNRPLEEIYSAETEEELKKIGKEKGISYTVFDPFSDKVNRKSFEERTGLRIDWLPNYLKTIAKHYKKHKIEQK